MATIGHNAAVADAFGMTFTGPIGYLMWGFIHVLYLIGWSNRLITLFAGSVPELRPSPRGTDHHVRTGPPRTHPDGDPPGPRGTRPSAAEAGLTVTGSTGADPARRLRPSQKSRERTSRYGFACLGK